MSPSTASASTQQEAALYLGLMSGTSMDAVDAALLRFRARGPELLGAIAHPLPAPLRDALQQLCREPQITVDRLGSLDVEVGRLFADAALQLLQQTQVEPAAVRAIGSHGQTVRHRPEATVPFSLQIGDPNVIAGRTGIVTVADFRRSDIAAGGQGAPLVPAFHRWLLTDTAGRIAVLNIGGIANLTLLANGELKGGFDTGPGNILLDAWCRKHRGQAFDAEGAWAAGGEVHEPLLAALRTHPFFQRVPPKSTGFEDFSTAWLEDALAALPDGPPAPREVMATLAQLTAETVAEALRRHWPGADRLYLCGGGAHNTDLVQRLSRCLPEVHLESTAVLGLAPDWVEAAAFAWLARARLQWERIHLEPVTGAARPALLGGVYRG